MKPYKEIEMTSIMDNLAADKYFFCLTRDVQHCWTTYFSDLNGNFKIGRMFMEEIQQCG